MSLRSSSSFMEEFSVSELLDKFNFFVPEIQREYVWGKNERNILASFCDDIIEGRNQAPNENLLQQKISKLTAEKKFSEIARLLEENNNGSPINIGFLYSYEPNYKMEHFPDSDIYKDTYLIDGQQRFTSLFLMLFYLSIKENKQKDFKQLFRYNQGLSTIAFDYRVRTLTHDFVIKLINEIKKEEDFNNLLNTTWFLDIYIKDVTIKSMVNGLNIIRKKFNEQSTDYFDFILEHIRFWHFKTEKTNQGEELYITMNSRGKQLEENETVRAKLFEQITDTEQTFWSEKWEHWQDYFWKNRNSNENADEGFNEFLKCIAGLEAYLNEDRTFVSEASQILDYHLTTNLSLDIIDAYFDAFMFLFNNENDVVESYEYAKWVDRCLKEIKLIILQNNTNWFIDYEDALQATERRRMVFIWSILYYIKKTDKEILSVGVVYRFLRIHWLRYNNYDRGVISIKDRVEETISEGLWSQCSTSEEELKHPFYIKHLSNSSLLRKFESRIWKIEDHRLNINGYQVDNINSTHLVDYSQLNDPKTLDDIYSKFIKIFPVTQRESDYSANINDVLMFYGFYGLRRTPFYYYNYDFSSWRRIVRDIDSPKKSFASFFQEFDGNNLTNLLDIKKEQYLQRLKPRFRDDESRIECDYFVDVLRLYIILCKNIWKHGRYVAYEDVWSERDALTTFERKNENQKPPYMMFYNTKGNFRGYGYSSLYSLLPNNHRDILNHLINNLND